MKKCKFFMSLAKERDWLEEMARQGWLLTNITMGGILYTFKEIAPCEKVFEVERFAISANPTISDLTARSNAIDIATQFGWEIVTHDEAMHYYFVKDKAGDETDEFYDDADTRKERAERFRKAYSIEQPLGLLIGQIFISICFFIMFFITENRTGVLFIYLLMTTIDLLLNYVYMRSGQLAYEQLSMSRKEWELHKKYSERKRFNKVQQLRSYLQEKNKLGLSLKGYEDGRFLFEKDSQRYNYFVDTRSCLKKRLKEEGITFKNESKDLSNISLKWYETSIANATQYGLKPVAVIEKNVLVYKRPYSDDSQPWENGNSNINFAGLTLTGALILLALFILGFIVGSIAAMIF